jgi:hypothetical protein
VNQPVERKVYAASLGALSSTIVSDFALWGVDQIWWPGQEEIPSPVAAFVSAVVVTVVTFLSGYLAKSNPEFVEEV